MKMKHYQLAFVVVLLFAFKMADAQKTGTKVIEADSLFVVLHQNTTLLHKPNVAKLPNAKTTAGTQYRLIAKSSLQYQGSKFDLVDTADYRYTGKRSISKLFANEWDFDTYYRIYVDSIVTKSFDEETSNKSYDATDRLISHQEQTFPLGNLYKTIARTYDYNIDGQISYYAYRNKFAPDSLWFSGMSVLKTFDKFGNALSWLDKSWDYYGAKWVTTNLQMNEYDTASPAHNRLLSELHQVWDSIGLVFHNFSKVSYLYDTAGHLLLKQVSHWDNSTANWRPSSKDTFLYDTKGFNIQIINSLIDTSARWVNKNNTYIFYDVSGNINRTIAQMYVAGSWVNTLQYDYAYVAGNLVMEFHSRWNATTAVFDSSDLYLYTFDAKGNRLSESKEYFNYPPAILKINERYLYTYDSENNPVNIIYQLKNNAGVWYNVENIDQEFNAAHLVTRSINSYWTGSAWAYNLNSKIDNFYYEEMPTSVASLLYKDNLFAVYPNPSSGKLVISDASLRGKQSESLSIKVYDLLGRVVYEQSLILNKAQTPLELNLAKGTYILELRTEDAVQRERILIQ